MHTRYFYLTAFLVFIFFSCKQPAGEKPVVLLDISDIDSSVRPGNDFYQYVNGKWYANAVIPPDQAGVGVVQNIYEGNRKKIQDILEETAGNVDKHASGSPEQMMAFLYIAAMDTATLDALGTTPVKNDLQRIKQLNTAGDIVEECARFYQAGIGVLFGATVDADARDATINRLQLAQDGLSLPSLDYYILNDSVYRAIRQAFVVYVANVFKAAGLDTGRATKNAQDILQLETRLARSHRTQVELQDPIKNYNKFSVTDLNKKAPGIDWKRFLNVYGTDTDTLLVGQPEYFVQLSTLLKTVPVNTWKNKLMLHLVEKVGLGHPFEDLKFNFYNTTLNGIKEKPVRWKQVVRLIDQNAGDLLGQVYVKKYFSGTAKQRMESLVENLQQVLAKRITALTWMTDSTKKSALKKLNAFEKKIGYPGKWKDYEGVHIVRDNHFGNMEALRNYAFKQSLKKINQPVDRSEWFMNASEVNAYYNPPYNEIVFPAGILQPPFFNVDADDALNYGAIGYIIGHEMTHGFDNYGRQFDSDGNLKDWWTEKDARAFNEKARVVVEQYNTYVLIDTLHVNGDLTLGENIADIGGLMIAYEAFKNTPQGRSEEKIQGLSPDERFFLSFANVWRDKTTEELMRKYLLIDTHSPDRFRLIGCVSNMPEFEQTFKVTQQDKMYRPDSIKVKIW